MTGFFNRKILPSLPTLNKKENPVSQPTQTETLTRFDRAVRYVLVNEDGKDYIHDRGGFTDDPRDPGGATMWGIIKTEYEAFLGTVLTVEQVSQMPRETALKIYRKKFWDVIHGDAFTSDAAATAIMDTAVNKGLGGCMTVLHDALNNPSFHYYGEAVAIVNLCDAKKFLVDFEAAMVRYIEWRVKRNPNMEWARKGWTNRATRLLALGAQ